MSPQPAGQLPPSLVARLAPLEAGVPTLLAVPESPAPAPVLLWFHGRTANKELDPGRYLRLVRAGIAACAVDLPGHGARAEEALQAPERALEVVARAADEVDAVVDALARSGLVDAGRMAIGGMSLGGMVAMVRLCRPHAFRATLLEATTGSWRVRAPGEPDEALARRLEPISHVGSWREIPVLALHAEADEWVPFSAQQAFIAALRAKAAHPERIELHAYARTGAPHEHVGFGRFGPDSKDRGTAFLARWLSSAP